MPDVSRRSILKGSCIATGGLLAGCIEGLGGGGSSSNLRIKTSSQSGTHYAFSSPVPELLNEHSKNPTLEATVSTSEGSVANMRAVHEENSEMGTSVDTVLWLAYNGTGAFSKELDVRTVMRASIAPLYHVVREGSDIETVQDLEGKTVTAGEAGSGTLGQHQGYMEELGVDVEYQNMSYTEGGRAIRDGDVDAWWIFHSPISQNAFAAAPDSLRVLGFTDSELQTLLEAFPYSDDTELTPDRLQGVDETKQVIGASSYWVTHPDIDTDVIKEFTRVVLENPEAIQEANQNSSRFGSDFAYFDLGVPYHEGAMEYFEEAGIV